MKKLTMLGLPVLIVSLFLGIFIGQQIGFTSPIILAAFVVALISAGIFVWIEQHVEQPFIIV